jgi:CheY-like chemotaxis protein
MMQSGTHKKRILVVDDESAIRKLCQRILIEEGFAVDTASDGKAALAMISEQDYELCLVDIKMPLMDGKELYESLQKIYPRIALRVVFSTGSAIGEKTESFFQSSGRPILRKPFTSEELKAKVEEALK